jgi:hypothetical protein
MTEHRTDETTADPLFKRYDGEPLPRWAYYVNVRLHGRRPNGDWIIEWRRLSCHSLDEAIRIAESHPEVKQCYEASWIPGGVVT